MSFLIAPLCHYEINVVSFELVTGSVTLLTCFHPWETSVLTPASLQTLLTVLLPSIHSLSPFLWNRATATAVKGYSVFYTLRPELPPLKVQLLGNTVFILYLSIRVLNYVW